MSAMDLEPGQTLSHFRMEKKLGEGGMGAVYLAEDLTLSRRVAIKFMSRNLLIQQGNQSVRESLEKRFIREAKSAAAINHPNLAQIYEANFDTDLWYIAMEFIDGASIYDMLQKGHQFSIDQIIDMTRQTVSGLDFAWDNYKIIHRDIKPHNIMLTKNNLVKIVDLGLAKPMESEETVSELPDLTAAGTPIGTPQYMAPEQATGQKNINYLVDIYALGATIYESCCGKKAFSGNTAPMIYMMQVQRKYTPLKELRSDVPPRLLQLIEDMLEPKPEKRIGSYKEILKALNEVGAVDSQQVTRVQMGGPASPTMMGHLSGKTIGMEQFTVFHQADKLIKDRYRILKALGKSRAGMVYHCMDTKLSVECLVKSIFPGREYPETDMPRITANFQRLMGYSHPNLVQIRDLQVDEETGEFFVVMELLNGQTLREYTHRLKTEHDKIEVNTIAPVMVSIAKALDSVSKSLGIIDHDLVPENIYLVGNDMRIKLLDYGIAYPLPDEVQHINPADNYRFPLANPDYMAPELWLRKSPVRQSDQYSLAVIVYEMIADRLPFWLKDPLPKSDAKDNAKLPITDQQLKYLYERVINEPVKPLGFLKKHENKALLKALAKDPHDRFSNCEEFIKAMSAAGMIPAGMVIPAIAAMVAVVGVIGFLILHRGTTDQSPPPATASPSVKTVSAPPPPPTPSADVSPQTPAAPEPPPAADAPNKALQMAMTPAADQALKDMEKEKQAKLLAAKSEFTTRKNVFDALYTKLKDDVVALEMLPQADSLIKDISTAVAREDFATALKTCDEAIAMARTIEQRTREIKLKRLLELKSQAESLQKTFVEQRQNIEKIPTALALIGPVDSIAEAAQAALAREDYPEAITQFKKAIDDSHNLITQFNKELKGEIELLKSQVEEERGKLNKYKGLSAELTEKIVTLDVTISLARESLNKENFLDAQEQYKKALEDCRAFLGLAENKFQAKFGQNFTDPKTMMDFIWIDTMKIWVSKYEVTNGDYRKFKATHDSKKSMGFSLNKDRQPVLEVSYYDAVGYCTWLNAVSGKEANLPDGYMYRLPSREEWETVARCGNERLYPWGNEWPPKYGNFGNQEVFPSTWKLDGYTDEFPVTCEVEKSGANEWGIFGMAGNVWEWTSELKDNKRAVLGGDWTSVSKATLIITVASAYAPMDEPFDNIGFRIFLALKTQD